MTRFSAPPKSASHTSPIAIGTTRVHRIEADTRLAQSLCVLDAYISRLMADRSRREPSKTDKFAALKLARQGGRREWKVCVVAVYALNSRRSDASDSSFRVLRERMRKYMMRSRRTNTRVSSRVASQKTTSLLMTVSETTLTMVWTTGEMIARRRTQRTKPRIEKVRNFTPSCLTF
jgi:hypothetical protein